MKVCNDRQEIGRYKNMNFWH